MCSPTAAAIKGAIASTATKTTRISDCTNAKVRPRTSFSTSMPNMVKPVTQLIPLNAPKIMVTMMAITKLLISAKATRKKPAIAKEAPNKRLRENCESTRGPNAMPVAKPVKTEPKSTPYAASPPPRSLTKVLAKPITAPAAMNAPTMPTTRPRIIFDLLTKRQPSRSDLAMLSPLLPAAGPLGISSIPKTTQAV